MNRMISRVVAGSLVCIVSSAAEPLLGQQSGQQTSAQQTSTQQSTQQQTTPAPQQPASQQAPPGQNTLPPIELPENPGHGSNNQQAPATLPPAQTPVPAQPNGTAVAPPIQVSGGAASKPAGVAIAPPKQRQVRSLLIKLGLIAGAGAAVGTVVGLSAASPGRVPGSGH